MPDPQHAWSSYAADEWSESIVCSMKLGGIDHLFFVSGSELAFLQEAIVKAEVLGRPAPRLVTMVHENVALNAAIGASMVTGQPAAAAAHVDAGTLHFGAAIHTAWAGGYPVLMLAGAAPRALRGSMRGSRSSGFQYLQEPRDQGEIVRQYTKMDHRLEHQDNPGLMVSRLLQVAMSEPRGPVYLSVPRETAMLPLPGATSFPTRDELGLARPTFPDPADARTVARWLIDAREPCICAGRAGDDPAAVEELVRLAELLAIPVVESFASRLNFPRTHDLHRSRMPAGDPDVLLIVEDEMQYAPRSDGTKVVRIGADPVLSRIKTVDFHADLWLSATPANVARAVLDAALSMLDSAARDRIERRRTRLTDQRRQMLEREEREGLQSTRMRVPTGRLVAYELGKLVDSRAIVLNDAMTSARFIDTYVKREEPRTYFRSVGSGGGWGPGAAFGAKLVAPDRDVILASGDGFFMFGEPLAALWACRFHSAPFLSVVFVNGSYRTGTSVLQNSYPDGYAARGSTYTGGVFDPVPDFAKLAEAAGGYGEYVTETKDVGPALQRGLAATRNGTAAVIAVRVPAKLRERRKHTPGSEGRSQEQEEQ